MNRLTTEGARRLGVLANRLDAVPAACFNMGLWDCGTSACAAGWACRMPEFQEAGLRMEDIRADDGQRAFVVLGDFFGIDGDDACNLFGPIQRTPALEAVLIRGFIKEHQPQPEVVPVPTGPAAPRVVRHRRVDRSLSPASERTAST